MTFYASRTELCIVGFQKYYTNNVISYMTFPLQLLRIMLSIEHSNKDSCQYQYLFAIYAIRAVSPTFSYGRSVDT